MRVRGVVSWADRGDMTELSLPEPWRSLVREWVPRLLAAWQADGADVPGGTVRWMAMPRPPDLLDGAAYFHFGPVVYACRCGPLVDFLSGRPVAFGGYSVTFPEPWPEVSGIPGGLLIRWKTPGVVHGLLARMAGVTVQGVRVYPTSLVVVLSGIGDRVLMLT